MIGDLPDSRRVYLVGKRHDIYCLVSAEDFQWALKWRWHYKFDKRGKKLYAVRSTRVGGRQGRQVDIYMHKALLRERMGRVPPSILHRIGDHGDGDSLNNQRYNLDWATGSHNCKTARVKTPKCPETGRFLSVADTF